MKLFQKAFLWLRRFIPDKTVIPEQVRTFKTIYVLEVISGIGLRKDMDLNGYMDVVLFICGVDASVQNMPLVLFARIRKECEIIYIKSLKKQCSFYDQIFEEAQKMRGKATPPQWTEWANRKVEEIGQEVQLYGPSPIMTIHSVVERSLN